MGNEQSREAQLQMHMYSVLGREGLAECAPRVPSTWHGDEQVSTEQPAGRLRA